MPFFWGGESVGHIRVGISTRAANRRMMKSQVLGVIVSLVVIALGVLAVILVDRQMRGSLRRLIAGTQRMSEGDLKQRVQIASGDELEELGKTFNRMADQLAQSHAGLEQKVQERTKELRQLTRVLQETQSRQLRVDRLAVMGEIAAGVSHEVRTPLNSLSINLQMLKRRLKRGRLRGEGDGLEETLAMLDAEVRRINQVVEDFMRFARPPREEMGEQNVNESVSRVLQLVDVEAARNRVKV
ncbi:MAG: HAMP domain-containing protein, partial [Dehalococcoidia bacterium]